MIGVSRLLRVSDNIYRRLLVLFPMQYHREGLSDEMAQIFRDMCREVYQEKGLGGLLQIWLSVLVDTLWVALIEQLQVGIYVTRERLLRVGGWSAVAGGVSIVLMAFTHGGPNWIFWVGHNSLNFLFPLIALLYLGLWVGLIAHQRQGNVLRTLGTLSGLSGSVILLGTGTWMAFRNYLFGAPTWHYYNAGWLMASAGLILYGLSSLRKPSPASGIVVSLASGLMMLAFYSLLPAHQMGALFPFDSSLFGTLTGVCWIVLGRILLADSESEVQTK